MRTISQTKINKTFNKTFSIYMLYEFASRCCGKHIYGDVVLLRSGPVSSKSHDETFCNKNLYEDCEKAEIRSKIGRRNVVGGYYNAMLTCFVYNM